MSPDARNLKEIRRHLEIDRDGSDKSQTHLIDAAAKDVPLVLKGMEREPYVPIATPSAEEIIVTAKSLHGQLCKRGHSDRPASWGIYELIERDFLGAEIAELIFPEVEDLSV